MHTNSLGFHAQLQLSKPLPAAPKIADDVVIRNSCYDDAHTAFSEICTRNMIEDGLKRYSPSSCTQSFSFRKIEHHSNNASALGFQNSNFEY